MRTIYHHMVHPAPKQKGTLEQFWNSLMHSMLPNITKVMHASYQLKLESVCSYSCITATTFLEYFYPRPCKWNAVTWQPQLSPSPLLLTMDWAKHSTIEVWRHRVLGEERGWWGYWWNMLASGYTLHNNNIVQTHSLASSAGHSGGRGWHI